MALTSSGLAVALAVLVHSFADLFSGFGADLPVLTTFYIKLGPYAPYFAGAGTVVFLVLLLLAFLAFHLPILKLGPVV